MLLEIVKYEISKDFQDHHISHIEFIRYPLSEVMLDAIALISLFYHEAESPVFFVVVFFALYRTVGLSYVISLISHPGYLLIPVGSSMLGNAWFALLQRGGQE